MTNDKVLQRANTSRNLLKVNVSRQIRFVGHVMRKNQLEAVTLTGMIDGKRATGRQRKTVMDWISAACGDKWNINEILKICQDRNEHLLIANSESDTALTSDRKWCLKISRAIRQNWLFRRDASPIIYDTTLLHRQPVDWNPHKAGACDLDRTSRPSWN